MRAFCLAGFDTPPALGDLPEPAPGEGELLVRVQASSVNPVDNAIAAGMLNGMFEHAFPVVLGRDFAGVVEAAGPGATLAEGADVFGFVLHADPAVGKGTWAELITVAQPRVASRPSGVDLAAAARALHPDGVDAVIDLVSYTPDAFGAYAPALKPDGRASSPLSGVAAGPGRFPVMAHPDADALERLAGLLEAGSLRVPIQRSYGLDEAGEALAALPTSHTQGKLALSVA